MTEILSIDQGTTNSKAILVDQTGHVERSGSAPVGLALPRPGWVEQDAEDLWQSVLAAITQCLAGQPVDLAAITLTNQRESVVAWRRSDGAPLGPVLGWQDRRTADFCTKLPKAAHDLVQRHTGLRIDPMFSAPKLRWLLDSIELPRSEVCLGTVESWLIWKLTGGSTHRSEAGNASRTLLFDVESLQWRDELLDLFDIPRQVLPEVIASDGDFGLTQSVPGVRDGVPIKAVLADSHAALFGHGCTTPGTGKATYGTGSSVMTPVGSFSPNSTGVPYTLAWVTGNPRYAREGNILTSGSGLAWMAQTLGLPDVGALSELAETVDDSAGVTFVPAFSGLGAPHWDRDAVAGIVGLSQGTAPAHLARAAIDAVAHQICDVLEEIELDGEVPIAELRADGGATESALLMQTQADLIGRPVQTASVAEVSALGAATLGWESLGVTAETAATNGRVFEPTLSSDARLRAREQWRDSVLRSRGRDSSR